MGANTSTFRGALIVTRSRGVSRQRIANTRPTLRNQIVAVAAARTDTRAIIMTPGNEICVNDATHLARTAYGCAYLLHHVCYQPSLRIDLRNVALEFEF